MKCYVGNARHWESLALFEWQCGVLRRFAYVCAVDKDKAMAEAQIGNLEDAEVVRRCSVLLQNWFYGHCGDLHSTLSVFGGLRSDRSEASRSTKRRPTVCSRFSFATGATKKR